MDYTHDMEEFIKGFPPDYTPEDLQKLIWAETGKWLNIDLIKKIRQVAKVLDKKPEK